ncbi:toxin glutamine deamidase domain-containing protein [Streptomyces albus]|uniref:toxin glutamine deamidase domain-containing protein n=1 Tax=Streptomyces albus TaxID=1888 RepID=UPI0004C75776|nr:toxin glutamine deamidase domain-containing protein [Streptomyces albus]
MHARDRRPEETERRAGRRSPDRPAAAPAAAPRGPVTEPATLLALQGTAGNAAVARMLAERHTAPAAHGTEALRTPVQRASAGAPPADLASQPAAPAQAGQSGPVLPPLEGVRDYARSGLKPADPKAQQQLEKSFTTRSDGSFERFADPTRFFPLAGLAQAVNKANPKGPMATSGGAADWVKNINSQRDDDPGFRRNCVDAARSFLASWDGRPTAAAGVAGEGVEEGGNDRTAAWLGTRWRTSEVAEAEEGAEAGGVWSAVEGRLKSGGHGSSAIVVFKRTETELVHAVNAVNYKGKVYWVDAQMGRISKTPMYNGSLFMTISLSPTFEAIDEPPPISTGL